MKKAVLMMSMGGPLSLKDVRPYLFNLFKDPAIIRYPFWIRIPLAYYLSWKRVSLARQKYQKMGGRSPLLENTHKQAHALEKALNACSPDDTYRCFVGMSYWHPFIKKAVQDIEQYGPDEVILLPLYPQFSTTTTVPTMRDAYQLLKKSKLNVTVNGLKSFYKNEYFIHVMVQRIEQMWGEATCHGRPMLLFSAHGLPEQIVQQGDPYPEHCQETMDLIVSKLSFNADATLCYQSRIGHQKWLEPYLVDAIDQASVEKRPIMIIPISFVCEYLETLVELQIEYRDRAVNQGAPFYSVIPPVGDDPFFISGLARLLTKK